MTVPLRSDLARALANLAIELGDPGRMAKARRLHRSNAVSTIEFEDATAYASVNDVDGTVADTELSVSETPNGSPIPNPEDLTTTCSCDDSANACRHVLATVLGIAEMVEIDPRNLSLWAESHRSGEPVDAAVAPTSLEDTDFFTGHWRDYPPVPTPRRLLSLIHI